MRFHYPLIDMTVEISYNNDFSPKLQGSIMVEKYDYHEWIGILGALMTLIIKEFINLFILITFFYLDRVNDRK